MKVLVTGGAGYIGSHTAKALHRAGYEPVVFDNLCSGHEWAVKWGPLVKGSLAERDLLARTLRQYGIEAVLHFAALIQVGESMRNPWLYFQNNTSDALMLLETMVQCGVTKLIFSSTCAVYGDPVRLPLDEEHPQNPVNPYGESKRMTERLLHWYGQVHGLRSVALRYFNAAGADADGEIGEMHDPESHLIPLVLDAVLYPERPVRVFGSDYATKDGTAVRDYIHVEDLAGAHVRALRYLLEGGRSTAFNVGTGTGYTVREVLQSVEHVTGREVPCLESPRRDGDAPELVADPRRVMAELGWKARCDLDTIIRSAWRWHTEGLPARAISAH